MDAELRSILTGTLGLLVIGVVALLLTLSRPFLSTDAKARRHFLPIALAAIVCQGLHFAEELSTQFYEAFPQQLGLAPWSTAFFVTFNATWLVIWIASALGVARRFAPAAFPLWFLALALMVNGVAHPILAVRAGGYFPGLLTAPLVAIAGFFLYRKLSALTTSARPYTPATDP